MSYVQAASVTPQMLTVAAAAPAAAPAVMTSVVPVLAHTGADASALLWAVALLLLGALLLVATRKGIQPTA